VCLQSTSRGYLLGPKVSHVPEAEVEAVLQRVQPATSWGQTDLIASNSLFPPYGGIFRLRT
jgi:hypothetical protein